MKRPVLKRVFKNWGVTVYVDWLYAAAEGIQ
jgi:hypothetical protein